MARRKDHTPEQLKQLIRESAKKTLFSKGIMGLTARNLAAAIGYAPGTIYNFYRDMDALVFDINFETLGQLNDFCLQRMNGFPAGFSKVKALAYAYVDFAHNNTRAWETLFSHSHKGKTKPRLNKPYQQRLLGLFQLIERTLQECLKIAPSEVPNTARLLWSCLHGITILTLDGRLSLLGVENSHDMIDDLLQRYLAEFLK